MLCMESVRGLMVRWKAVTSPTLLSSTSSTYFPTSDSGLSRHASPADTATDCSPNALRVTASKTGASLLLATLAVLAFALKKKENNNDGDDDEEKQEGVKKKWKSRLFPAAGVDCSITNAAPAVP